jgi:RNA polymerase sigma-70 factor (ECF subfamily)
LFRQHYSYVCNIIHKYVGDKSKVEDIAQELFSELWIKRDTILIHTSLVAYLRRMAISRSLNYLRDTRKHDWDDLESAADTLQDPMYQSPAAIMQLEMAELRSRIDQAIEGLPEKCRVVFLLSRNDEMSYAEISQQLGISVKTVENQIGKALKLLRLALQDYRG